MTLDWALRTAFLLAVACAVSPLLRPASAATRHLYWRLAMIAVLLLPLLAAILFGRA